MPFQSPVHGTLNRNGVTDGIPGVNGGSKYSFPNIRRAAAAKDACRPAENSHANGHDEAERWTDNLAVTGVLVCPALEAYNWQRQAIHSDSTLYDQGVPFPVTVTMGNG